jgi:maleamate amidohydrolase
MTDDYQRRSYGEISVGTGEKPGIVVVDFQLGFTDPQYPLGGAPLVMRAVENTAKLLKVARRVGVPVAVCNAVSRHHRLSPVVAFCLVLLGCPQVAVSAHHR